MGTLFREGSVSFLHDSEKGKVVQNISVIGGELVQMISKLKAGALFLFYVLFIRKLASTAVLCTQ